MDTVSMAAMGTKCKLMDVQLKEICVFIQLESELMMEHKTKELMELHKGPVQHFGLYDDYYGKTKIVERCKYWTTDCGEELEYGI
jgi:hypothetical protein